MKSEKVVNSVAISGIACSGKTTLARRISKLTGWDHKNTGDYLRELARIRGLSIEDFGKLDEQILRDADTLVLQEMKSEVHHIWEGRLSIWLAKGIEQILKVYCVADLDERIRRFSYREGVTSEEAEIRLLKRDEAEREVFLRLYGIESLLREAQPDMILDTSSSDTEEISKQIMSSFILR